MNIDVILTLYRMNTPNRKRSMEEKRTTNAPSLTIPDATPMMAGLTESSSSGMYILKTTCI